ncbi:MAG TPA: hypothetical protein PK040_07180, partial [Anaerolineaceae bacterium]|nr:hypothetical protein [Anaerolineaceae bacterium]
IIYGGSTIAMLGAFFQEKITRNKLIREGLVRKGIKKGNFFQGLAALVSDPVKFGPTWQMVFMNFGQRRGHLYRG